MSKKKTKRIISLVLALTMIFTFMAMSASAAVTRATCPNCGGWDTVTGSRSTVIDRAEASNCSKMTLPHMHVTYHVVDFSRCRSCGYEVKIDEYDHTVCK